MEEIGTPISGVVRVGPGKIICPEVTRTTPGDLSHQVIWGDQVIWVESHLRQFILVEGGGALIVIIQISDGKRFSYLGEVLGVLK